MERYLEGAENYLDEKEWKQLTGRIVKFSMDYDEDLLGFWDGDARIETEPIYQVYEIIGNALERDDTEKFKGHLAEIIKSNDRESPIARDAMGLMEKLTGKAGWKASAADGSNRRYGAQTEVRKEESVWWLQPDASLFMS